MSDSSSAESSDDDLLASPVFKKRDRRTERAEKTKLDFFDSCLKGSDARIDVHRRIAEVDNEFKGNDNDNDNDEEEGDGGGDASDGGAAGEEGGSKEAKVESSGGSDNDGKENVQNNNAASKTTEPVKPKSASAVKSESPPNNNNNNNNNDEQAYWAKIESFEATNAQKTPGAHSARRALTDAVSGLLDYGSDLTDDEEMGFADSKWKDGTAGMTREQMRSEAEAKSQGLSSSLGMRNTFRIKKRGKKDAWGALRRMQSMSVKEEEGAGMQTSRCAFDTRKEAIGELKSIVTSLQKQHRIPKTPSEKMLRKQLIDPLAKIVKKPQDDMWDLLAMFLKRSPVMKGKNKSAVLPEALCKWVWKMACSSFEVGEHVSTDCCNLIRQYLVKELDVREENNDEDSFGVEMPFLNNMCMNDLVSCLENDFGLWLENGPMTVPEKNDDGDDAKKKVSKDEDATLDVYALRNVFLIWMKLFHQNLVQIGEASEDGITGADASKALVAFTRVGLDPHFHLANESANTCGEQLPLMLQKLNESVVKTTAHQILKQFDKTRVEQWMKHTAGQIVEACSNLSAGDGNAADNDDVDGHLPLAMTVKKWCSCELNKGLSMDIALMKLNLAELALHECLDEVTDWESKVKERTEYLCKDWNKESDDASGSAARERLGNAMHALVTAEVGFGFIDEESESFARDHPHFLASVLIAGECALIGACIYWRTQNDSESEEPVYSTEERDAVYECFSNIEGLCDGLKKECRAVIAYPHLRRTKEYLTRFVKMLATTKGKSSKYKKQKRREQGSLDSYFSRQSMSDPFREDTQDS